LTAGQLRELSARIAQLEQGNPRNSQNLHNFQNSQNSQNLQNPPPEPISMADFQPLMQWSDILEICGKINPAVVGSLAGSEAIFHANIILITPQNPLFNDLFKIPENAKSLSNAVEQVMGRRYSIRVRRAPDVNRTASVEEMLEKAKNSGIPTTAV
ncbi:MAG: hypothetical protein K2J71_04555, partial [Oscillospiraceae bacterium]|nr:hypothetical protein [Oscillospiraceae bacterium]